MERLARGAVEGAAGDPAAVGRDQELEQSRPADVVGAVGEPAVVEPLVPRRPGGFPRRGPKGRRGTLDLDQFNLGEVGSSPLRAAKRPLAPEADTVQVMGVDSSQPPDGVAELRVISRPVLARPVAAPRACRPSSWRAREPGSGFRRISGRTPFDHRETAEVPVDL